MVEFFAQIIEKTLKSLYSTQQKLSKLKKKLTIIIVQVIVAD